LAQFVVDEWEQFRRGARVTGRGSIEESRDIRHTAEDNPSRSTRRLEKPYPVSPAIDSGLRLSVGLKNPRLRTSVRHVNPAELSWAWRMRSSDGLLNTYDRLSIIESGLLPVRASR